MAPQDLRVSEEELALVHDKLMDAARKRLAGETAIRVERVLEGLDPGDFVVVAAPRDVEEPFYLAQVLSLCFSCVSERHSIMRFYFVHVLNRCLITISTMTR
jgi:hypothetical protein